VLLKMHVLLEKNGPVAYVYPSTGPGWITLTHPIAHDWRITRSPDQGRPRLPSCFAYLQAPMKD
jgi:hypothetical protein